MKSGIVYSKNQIEKLGNTLVYLCDHINPISKTHILKLVFIIEEISIKKYGIPFFDLRFNVWKLGPVSQDLFAELSGEPVLLSEFICREKPEEENSPFKKVKEFSDDEFSDNELKLLETIVDRFKYCTAKELINYTHKKDSPWYNTAYKHGILEELEAGKINTTGIEIKLEEAIANDKAKYALYKNHKEFLSQSKSLKA